MLADSKTEEQVSFHDSNTPCEALHILVTVVVRCVRCAGRTVRAIARKGAVERVLEVHRNFASMREIVPAVLRGSTLRL